MKKDVNNSVYFTQEKIYSFETKCIYRTSPKHFTRKSPLDFINTSVLTLNMVKKSAKVELMNYFDKIEGEIEIPSRQALAQAREKIDYRMFKDIFDHSCTIAINPEAPRLYKGIYKLLALDGTSFAVGDLAKLLFYFGKSTTIKGKAMCRIGGVVDVLKGFIVSATVSPFKIGERALAIEQIKNLKDVSNALYLFDRGYWSSELVSEIIRNGQKFLMRLASNNANVGIPDSNLRKYSFTLPGGNTELLLTNLSEEEVSDMELGELYAKRWGIETKYLELKDRLQIDKFSGESANIILQDIYSTLYISNLVAFICDEADEEIAKRTQDKGNKYGQKANRTYCISALRLRFVKICLLPDKLAVDLALDKLIADISKEVSYINKSKPRPRNKRQIKDARRHKHNSIL